MKVKIKRMPGSDPALPLPTYQTDGAAGMDLYADLEQPIVLNAWGRVLVPTGISIQMPKTMEAQVRTRSGLALKQGLTVLNSPGTIDSDFTGMIGVILMNNTGQAKEIKHGDRIAQMVFSPVLRVELDEVAELDNTARGSGGFGSSGVSLTEAKPTKDFAEEAEKFHTAYWAELEELDWLETIRVTQDEYDKLVELIENPPEPNEKLIEAARSFVAPWDKDE